MKLFIFILAFIAVAASGCGLKERERELSARRAEVDQKEQALMVREQALQTREAELVRREQLLDSTLHVQDTISDYEVALVGKWQVVMNCTETSCEGSAIGDTKTEQWTLDYRNNGVTAEAFSGKKLVRIYSGKYKNGQLNLTAQQEEASETTIIVTLRLEGDKRMAGDRQIIQKDKCKIVYSIAANKL